MSEEFFDVVVIGSGFGGSVAACRAAEAGARVLVLERGKLYRPGEFARSPLQMSTNLWDPSEGLFGLFQLWSFRRLDAVVASGVGGGSLIYANVVLPMPERWFAAAAQHWPLSYDDLTDHYPTVEKMLGAEGMPSHLDGRVPKVEVFTGAAGRAGMRPHRAPLAVTFSQPEQEPGDVFGLPEDNLHGFRRRTCRLCGECDLGCNEGAKNTLDFTYLSRAVAQQQSPAEIRPLHEVKRITATDRGYLLDYVVHQPFDPAWDRVPRQDGDPRVRGRVRARKVVVAAGALGSTRLLLANRTGLPYLSGTLGSRFSGNGDAVGFLTGSRSTVVESAAGPVITGYAERDEGDHYIEDGGHPAFLAWLSEAFQPGLYGRTAHLLLARWWERRRGRSDSALSANAAKAIGAARVSRSTLPLLAMGVDPSTGTMRLRDGRLDLDWSAARSQAYFERVWATMTAMATMSDARFRRGPSALLSRNITAHPLGGSPMGRDPAHGVVDSHGEAFGHPGLFVADGSVVPVPVGANPSMTIAALAERFSEKIAEKIVERAA